MTVDVPLCGLIESGNENLDRILYGGLPRERICLVHGAAGTGKSTLALQFLLKGVQAGERTLFVTLLQTRDELEGMAESHGWTLGGIEVLQLPEEVKEATTKEQSVFPTSEVEMTELRDAILEAVRFHKPQRLVLDSVTELSVLMDGAYQLRLHLLTLKREIQGCHCTAIFTSSDPPAVELAVLETLAHGAIALDYVSPSYGSVRRRLQVRKMRGQPFMTGYHNFRISTGGLDIYPRLEVDREEIANPIDEAGSVISGNADLDALLGGGLEAGTSCLITGTTGAGKSTLASLFVQAAAARGEHSTILCFDERRQTFIRRAEGLGLEITRYINEGLVTLRQIDAASISPGELAHLVREAVEQDHSKIVVIDSVTGYLQCMPEERHLSLQLHELLNYLSSHGVLTFMVVATHGITAAFQTAVDASYLADTVVLMRHFEASGVVRRCISVLKKRHGLHEKTIREFRLDQSGLKMGSPLQEFSGVFTGEPVYNGDHGKLLNSQ